MLPTAIITHFYFQIATTLVFILIAGLLFLRKIQHKYILILLIIISLVPKLFYLYNNNYYMLPNDVPGHVDYIKIVAQKLVLPKPTDCWQCYHPPLFYISGAVNYHIINLMGIINDIEIFRIIQFYTLFIFFIFLLVSILIINEVLGINKNSLLAVGLLLFWPSGTIHALRIANDAPAYLFFALSLLFLIKWWQTNSTRSLILSGFFSATGLLVKSNLAVMASVLFVCFIYKIYFSKIIILQRAFEFIILFVIFSIAILFNQRSIFLGMKQDDALIGNYKGVPVQVYGIGNGLLNYIGFDFEAYINYSTIIAAEDKGGRQYFLNYLLKTGLFSEVQAIGNLQAFIARIISYLLFCLIIFAGIGLFSLRAEDVAARPPLLILASALFLSLAAFRYKYPLSPSNDFRYIYPILIPFVIFIVWSYRYLHRHIMLKGIYYFAILQFILLSFIYYFLPLMKVQL